MRRRRPTDGRRGSPRARCPARAARRASRDPSTAPRVAGAAGRARPMAGRRRCATVFAAAQQHGVASAHPSFLAAVELDEIGAASSSASPTKTATLSCHLARAARPGARRGLSSARMKPSMSAPASTAASTSSRRVSPQTLTSGRERSSRSFAAGSSRLHQRRADENRVGACELCGSALRAGVHAALGHDHAVVAAHARDQLELRCAVDLERRQVACVDADHFGAECDRALELVAVMRLDEGLEAELARVRQQRRGAKVVDVAQQEQHCVGARDLRLQQVELLGEEALGEERRRRRRARGLEIVERAAERSSTRIEIAAAPALANCAASRAGSASGRRSPAEGERRLTSAIAPRPGAARASRNRPIRRQQSLARRRSAARAARRPRPSRSPRRASDESFAQVRSVPARGDRARGVEQDRVCAARRPRRRRPRGSPPHSRRACRHAAPRRCSAERRAPPAGRARARAPSRRRPRRRGSCRPGRARRCRRLRGRRRRDCAPSRASTSAIVRTSCSE